MITRDDWLSALEAAKTSALPDTDAFTLKELTDVFGCGRKQAELRVSMLVAANLAERTTKQIRRIDGGVVSVPAYRLLEVPHAKRRRNARRVRARRSRS
jgi:hypothetical protein